MRQSEGEKLKGIQIPPAVLLREILRGWRIITLAVVLCAVLFAGFRYVRFVSEKNSQAEEDTETVEMYEKAAAVIEAKIESRKEYLENSILVDINPYKMAFAETTVIISSDDQTIVDEVFNRLSMFLRYMFDWSEFAREKGVKPEYLKELVSTTDIHVDNLFVLRVRHNNEEDAAEMMVYLLEVLKEKDAELQETVGAHKITIADWTTRTDLDTSYADYSENQYTRLGTLENTLKSYKDKAEAARGSTVTLSVKALLKYAVLGAALGFVGAVFLLFVFIFLKDRLLDARELKPLYGMNNLAVFPQDGESRKNFVLDRRIALIGRDPAEKVSVEERYAIIVEKLAVFAPNARSFALIGDVKEKELTELAEQLSANVPSAVFAPAPLLAKNASSLKSVLASDAVILVGKINASRFGNEDRELELASELGKKAAGSIVI